ncbi:MAG: hypothetical protein ABI304_08980 [Rudaea sp.]
MGTVLVYGLVSLIIGIAIGAGIIMLSMRLVAGFTPKFLLAAATAIVAWIAVIAASWILGMILGHGTLTSLLALVVFFVVNAAIINALLKRPDGGQIGFGKACLVTLVELIIEIVLGVILFFVFGAGLLGMFAGMAATAPH